MSVATTRMSSKGQVVIPEEIRAQLGLKEGSQFVVVGRGDTVVLKSIEPPPVEQFEELIRSAQKAAKEAGIKKKDVASAIKRVRRQR